MIPCLTRNIFHNLPPLCNHNNDDPPLGNPSHQFPMWICCKQHSGSCLRHWPEPPHLETCISYLNWGWRIIIFGSWVCWVVQPFHSTAFSSVCAECIIKSYTVYQVLLNDISLCTILNFPSNGFLSMFNKACLLFTLLKSNIWRKRVNELCASSPINLLPKVFRDELYSFHVIHGQLSYYAGWKSEQLNSYMQIMTHVLEGRSL